MRALDRTDFGVADRRESIRCPCGDSTRLKKPWCPKCSPRLSPLARRIQADQQRRAREIKTGKLDPGGTLAQDLLQAIEGLGRPTEVRLCREVGIEHQQLRPLLRVLIRAGLLVPGKNGRGKDTVSRPGLEEEAA